MCIYIYTQNIVVLRICHIVFCESQSATPTSSPPLPFPSGLRLEGGGVRI